MAKQLNVNLAFTADTAQAKAQIKDLNNTLDTLMKGSATTQLPLTKELQQAQSAAATLKVALNQAFNEKTGKLDLTQFSDSLKKADLDAAKLRQTFEAFGPAGSQAFMGLAKSVAAAELPLKRTNGLMSELWTTMKNTARWQLSSTVLHGFMGTVQNALYYAQDLDKSLNNIRIVTGYSAGEMASFAEQANKAAKALSTTTTKYTDASLIYFQQGLDKEQVAEMADITVRMANVTGQSSQVVSDQLTAIWNNFNKSGEESYEKYADILTALGAATASSTDEIAGGLEKFASIADMIGLSYEYAASALATITATTRQSEDVVGTALKTIFARIQGLSLGETLDDGTDLNKYSQALEKVGISIFDQNNQLKDMDLIIDEIGNKWSTLNKDQQVALAQTVAGVRQYNQLVSLFDNWDYFGENLNVAMTAEGELDKQAEIYAESWQAARDRVKAAAEDIYDSILDDKAFIFMLNSFEKLLSVIGAFTESIGGLPGVIGLVGIALTKAFGPQLTASLDNIIYKFNSLTGANAKTAKEVKNQFLSEAEKISYDDGTNAGAATADAMRNQIDLQKQIASMGDNLTSEEKERLATILEINSAYAQQAIEKGKLLDDAQQKVQDETRDLRNTARRAGVDSKDFTEARGEARKDIESGREITKDTSKLISNKDFKQYAEVEDQIKNITKSLQRLDQNAGSTKIFQSLASQFKNGKISADDFRKSVSELVKQGDIMGDAMFHGAQRITGLNDQMSGSTREADALMRSILTLIEAEDAHAQATKNQASALSATQAAINNLKTGVASFSSQIVGIANGLSQMTMGITSLVSGFQALGNSDLSFGEKLLQATMSFSMAIPMLITGLSQLVVIKRTDIAASLGQIKAGISAIPILFAEKTAVGQLVVEYSKKAVILANTKMAQASATGATITHTVAQKALSAAIWATRHAFVSFLGVIGLIAGAVSLAVIAIKKYQDAQNADAIAADNAATAAQNLATAYNEAKSSYEQMISSMDNYKSARDGLDSLTKGTQEYNEALKEANRQALELIQNNPEYFPANTYSYKDGEIIIDEDAMRRAQKSQEVKVDNLYAASVSSEAKAQEAQTTADRTDLAKQIASTNVGGFNTYKDLIDKSIQEYQNNPTVFASQGQLAGALDIDPSGSYAKALWANRDAIIANSEQIAANTNTKEITNQQIVDEVLNRSDSPVKTSAYKQDVIDAADRGYGLAYDNSYEDFMNKFNKGVGLTSQSKYEQDYAEAMGLNSKKGLNIDMGTDGSVTYSYLDEETGERTEEKTASAEEVASILATAQAMDTLANTAGILNSAFSNLEEGVPSPQEGAVKGFLTGEGLTQRQLEAANRTSKDIGVENYLKQSLNLGDVIDPEELTALGFESAEALISAFQTYLNNAQVSWDGMDFMDQLEKTEPAKTQFVRGEGMITTQQEGPAIERSIEQDIAFQDISLETAQAIENAFNQISLGPLGEEGGQAYIQGLMDVIYGMDPQTGAKVLDEMMKVDLSDADSIDQLKVAIESFGFVVDETNPAWQAFCDIINSTTFDGAASQLKGLEDQLITLKGILGEDGLMAGTEVSKEDMQTLIDTGTANEDDFMFTGTGYEYIGEHINMENAGLSEQLVLLQERKALYEDYVNSIQNEPETAALDYGDLAENGTEKELMDAASVLQESDTMTPILESLGIAQDKLDSMNADQLREVMAAVQEFLSMGAEGVYDQMTGEILASSAENGAELREMWQEGKIGLEDYEKGLERLQNTLDEDIDTEEWEDLADSIQDVAEESEDFDDALKTDEKAAKEVAKEILRFNDAIEDVRDNYDDWMKAIQNKTLQENTKAMKGMREAYSDMLDIDGSQLSEDFLNNAHNLDLMKQAAEGSEAAYEELQAAAGKDILAQVGIDTSQYDADLAEIMNQAATVEGAGLADVEAGAALDNSAFLQSLTDIVNQAGMTADQATAYLASMGIDAEVETSTDEEPVTRTVNDVVPTVTNKGTLKVPVVAADGSVEESTVPVQGIDYKAVPTTIEDTNAAGSFALKVTSANKSSGGGLKHKHSSNGGGGKGKSGGGGGGGGGGGKSTPAKIQKRTHRREVSDPYRKNQKTLDKIADSLEDIGKLTDRLYGKSRLNALEEYNAGLEEQLTFLQEKVELAQKEVKADQEWLKLIGSDYGVSFKFNEDGSLDEEAYKATMDSLYTELARIEAEAIDKFKNEKDWTQEKQDDFLKEEGYEELQDKINALQDAVGVYDESVEALREAENALYDAFYEWQDNNYEILHYTLEIKLDLNEMDLEFIDYITDKLTDNFYEMKGVLEQMIKSSEVYKSNAEASETFLNDLDQKYIKGEISHGQYIEGMKEVYENILEALSALNDLDKEILKYYGETLAAASEELEAYTSRLEMFTDVLDHYLNVVQLVKGEAAYADISKILNGQAKTIQQELAVSKQYYEGLLEQKKSIEASLAATPTDDAHKKQREGYEQQLKDLNEVILEAQSEMLSKTEAWAEIQLSIYENTMLEAAHVMEMAMTNNMGFDSLSNSVDRLNSHADVYLTKTNQIYEMQTLINKVNLKSEQIANKAAQERLKAFKKETEALKEKNTLSHLELEIQQAKYDLLLAEIALEEAQNAKSTVRLQRDSEGNFGYVYTADAEKVAEAEQNVLDAQNNLYNIGLENANEYGQKLLQLRQENAEALIELEEKRREGLIDDEQYEAEKARITKEYNDLRLAYSEQYMIALGAHSEVEADAWITNFGDLLDANADWEEETEKYLLAAEKAWNDWTEAMYGETSEVASILNNLGRSVESVINESEKLATTITNTVVPGILDEIEAVRADTDAYMQNRDAIYDVIKAKEELASNINTWIHESSEIDASGIGDFSLAMAAHIAEGGSADSQFYKYLSNQRYEKMQLPQYKKYMPAADRLDQLFRQYEKDKNEGLETAIVQYVDSVLARKQNFNDSVVTQLLTEAGITPLATGGYTGSWGSEGRLAILHEKELVLNAHDTNNFLQAMNIVREIAKSIDLENLRQQYSHFIENVPSLQNYQEGVLEQNVHIEANFPNVTDKTEIEDALYNLVNVASQYANKKRL